MQGEQKIKITPLVSFCPIHSQMAPCLECLVPEVVDLIISSYKDREIDCELFYIQNNDQTIN